MLILILAFSLEYPLIVIDEPENNLDEKNISIFRELLDKTTKEVIIISHNDFDNYDKVELWRNIVFFVIKS